MSFIHIICMNIFQETKVIISVRNICLREDSYFCHLLYFLSFPSLDSHELRGFLCDIFWYSEKSQDFVKSTTQWQFDQTFPILLVLSPSFLVLLVWIITVKKITWRAKKSLGLVCCAFKVQKIILKIGIFLDTPHNSFKNLKIINLISIFFKL